ncbi:alpha-2-macroglobulin [Aquabacterium sp.]|uniref:alpha-2-macroglobulin family protein n=1 Tax=Aquabacterium sp. TaxID=1872578 RepID=UPI0024899985|nr:alpha-2-macroglobulin [Aquabacterium sp.]MDI1258487.1 alpha-2-macroglobulin [Aquabacterium sp.]
MLKWLRLALMLVLSVLVTACVDGWLKQKPATASSVAVNDPQEFTLADCKPRMLDGSPAVAVMFTQPLARSQDFSRSIKAFERAEGESEDEARPLKGRWVLGDNPRVLYLPYALPAKLYRIELTADVASQSGRKLPAAVQCKVTSEAMPESYYFASRGVVLPAGQNGGLPVVSVNTPEVDVQFLRIEQKSLPAFLEQVGGRRVREHEEGSDDEGESEGGADDDYRQSSHLKGTVAGYYLDQLRESATSVYMSRFTTDPRKNRRNVNFLPVEKIKELQEPGVYVAVMNAPGRFGWDYQVTYFYVTDIGLHVRRHSGQTDAFATSLKSGEALSGIDVSVIDDSGKAMAQAKTDRDGHAVFQGSLGKARAVLARRGKELSVQALHDPALDLSEFDVAGHPSRNVSLFVYSGRDIYRPGEQFNVSILARDADGKPLPTTAAGAPAPLTLTLKQPNGEKVQTLIVRPQDKGTAYYQQALTLGANAPTGKWLVEVKTDPGAKRADAQWSFQVEEFLPERMKLNLKAPEEALEGDGSLSVRVEGDYLYGAPAAGNRLLGSAVTERLRNPLPQAWPGFIFGDVNDDKVKKRQDLGEVALDEQGHAEVSVPMEMDGRQSPMNVRASFSLLETGGRPVVRSLERTWWPAPTLVGLRPLFDRDVAQEGGLAEFELIRTDASGKFVPAKAIAIKLIREDRQWYWRYDDNRGWNSGYNVEEELLEARTVTLKSRQKISLPVQYGSYRLELHDAETGQTARYKFYAGWGAQDADDIGNRPDRVQLKLEGAPYKPGDAARLTITPPHDGQALVTVEGDRVLYQRRVEVSTRGTTIEIPVDPSWNRHDLYIGVVTFRPGSEGDRVTPARALGLVHLPLSRQARTLKLSMTAPAKTQPEVKVPVKVRLTDAAGNPFKAGPAMVTLSAVDVGILNITRFATPDPADFFFGKHRYDADVLDLYGKLIEKMEGTMAKQRFGGDASKRDTQSMPRKVKLVDLFSGPVMLDAQGEATIALPLPDFNGTLRLMAVASTADSYANAEVEMVVAAPIVAELSMPRFIAPGDTATLALDVTNLSGAPQEVSVKAEAGQPVRLIGTLPTVKLADKQRTVMRLTAEASDALGLAPIKLTITAGKLSLVREAALQVQPATPQVREVQRVRLDPQGSHRLTPTLLDALWAGSATVDVSISNRPPINVREVVQGLLMYPYGCLEQTTSSAYPLVFIDEEGAKAVGLSPLSREERAKRLDTAFSRLAGMQQPTGGFGLWSTSSPYEAWLSAYATGFLQDAADAGFAVPDTLRQRALASLLEQFQRAPGLQTKPPAVLSRDANGLLRDYREIEALRMAHQRLAEAAHEGYILARDQKAPLATLRTLHDDYRGNARSPLPLVHLGLALKLMGDEARAKVAFDEAMRLGYGIQQTREGWYDWLGDYGSEVRDTALAYAMLVRHKVNHPQRENLLVRLVGRFGQRQYYSTQERLALFLAARAAGGDATQAWQGSIKVGNRTEAINAKGTERRSFDVTALKRGISLTSTGTQPLFVEVISQGYPVKPLAARDDSIVLDRSWWSTDGKSITTRQFKTGEMFIVRLRVQAKQHIKDGLVVDRIPAGFEIENLNISQGTQAKDYAVEGVNLAAAMDSKRIQHVEFRDDRFVVAADLDNNRQDFFYLVRAVTPGKFVVPATFAEDMYRPELRGVGKAEPDITVQDPRQSP